MNAFRFSGVDCRAQLQIPPVFGALPVHEIKMALTSIPDDLQNNAGTPNSIKNCR
jgi:hypothetical protein